MRDGHTTRFTGREGGKPDYFAANALYAGYGAQAARTVDVPLIPNSIEVWQRFRGACDAFFTRRQDDLGERKKVWHDNLAKKDALCARAEALASTQARR